MGNRFFIKEQLNRAFAALASDVVCARLKKSGIVYSPIANTTEVIEDKHLIVSGVIVPFETDVPSNAKKFAAPINIT